MKCSTYLISAVVLNVLLSTQATAAECNNHNGFTCEDNQYQFDSSFTNADRYPNGGFGGGSCKATKTPVIFIHGNGDNAMSWLIPPHIKPQDYPLPPNSVYDSFKKAGYNDCELFGVTYLSAGERDAPENNYHTPESQQMIANFIDDVRAYTGQSKVNVVGHSLGVSMAMSSLTKHQQWSNVERFVGIAGGLRGLSSCLYTGYASTIAPTCNAQNLYDQYTFGFYPDSGALSPLQGQNKWTGTMTELSMRNMPKQHPDTRFYTISAGIHDQIHCTTKMDRLTCHKGPQFNQYSNVYSQINLGTGSLPAEMDFDFSDSSPYNLSGGDLDGVGHFNSKIHSGAVLVEMLTTDCSGAICGKEYHYGPVDAL